MIRVRAGDCSFDAAAFVFDKDGLLFESRAFWIALAEERLRQLRKVVCHQLVMDWADCFGIKTKDGITVLDVDASGILAVASPTEEIASTAALIVREQKICWTEARDISYAVFRQADDALDLGKALKPRQGFPEIMRRLRSCKVPYGVATSDTAERAIESFRLFDDPKALSFVVSPRDVSRGKPYPDMLELISQRLGIPKELLVMVGDSYVDVEMARRAGAIGIGIPETEQMSSLMHQRGAIVLDSLDQIRFEQEVGDNNA